MQTTILLSMLMFSLSMSISPGPINMAIISSSISHGFIKTFPFISGATIGFTLLLIFIGFFFAQTINNYPLISNILELSGSLFIIYIGYKIMSSQSQIKVTQNTHVLSFFDGFLLQWFNPKAWIACTSGVALFSIPNTHTPLIIFIGIYFLICYLSLALWGIVGQKLSIILNHPYHIHLFNIFMGASLIILSIHMILKNSFN